MAIVNIAAYKFVDLSPALLATLGEQYKQKTKELALKGTILLSPEGINIMLAGSTTAIAQFKNYLVLLPIFSDLTFKESLSKDQPYKRMYIKIKKEIITFGVPDINPAIKTAPHLDPKQLKQWYDEQKPMLVLDTRNTYEIEHGAFKDAVQLNIESFTEFSHAIKQLPESSKGQPVITYCTGGIRCEKAAAFLLNEGFKEVYQLEGGILNYFSQCGDAHYQGNCFVFDDRVAVNANLEEVASK